MSEREQFLDKTRFGEKEADDDIWRRIQETVARSKDPSTRNQQYEIFGISSMLRKAREHSWGPRTADAVAEVMSCDPRVIFILEFGLWKPGEFSPEFVGRLDEVYDLSRINFFGIAPDELGTSKVPGIVFFNVDLSLLHPPRSE